MELTTAQITAWLGQFLWPLFRIGALLMVMPLIGSAMVPMRIRLVLALAISFLIAPLLPAMPMVDPLSGDSLLILLQQLLIGFMGGMLLHIYYAIFAMTGQMVSLQMGLGMAMMYDPINGVSIPIIGQVFQILTSLMFLAMNGHLVVINVLVHSFETLPVAPIGADMLDLNTLTRLMSWATGAALIIALPAITSMLLVNISFGVMNRAAPQLNVFSLGFPMSMMAGVLVLMITVSGIAGLYLELTGEALEALDVLLRGG
ncbi:flagellar biosynthetic protein FliR [Kistimonas asteriae]|uniref:flagellar biosynthetic protein FliR n=1 Tax=Kistimonas asteriae TaxID=517724 RepID=UPI001BA56B4F|nr:flagellar biosynthetic protein FliR [Kistimonas asteriae]